MEITIEQYASKKFPITTVKEFSLMRDVTRPTVYRWLELDKIDYITLPIELANGSTRVVKHIKINK